jgi:hypothetical protein
MKTMILTKNGIETIEEGRSCFLNRNRIVDSVSITVYYCSVLVAVGLATLVERASLAGCSMLPSAQLSLWTPVRMLDAACASGSLLRDPQGNAGGMGEGP